MICSELKRRLKEEKKAKEKAEKVAAQQAAAAPTAATPGNQPSKPQISDEEIDPNVTTILMSLGFMCSFKG